MLTKPPATDTLRLPAAAIHHDVAGRPADAHYDLLLADPELLRASPAPAPDDRFLWTARVALPPSQWPVGIPFPLTPLPHHRWAYLEYQGPLTQNRGKVTRVDQGTFTVTRWSPNLIDLSITWSTRRGRLVIETDASGAMMGLFQQDANGNSLR